MTVRSSLEESDFVGLVDLILDCVINRSKIVYLISLTNFR